MHDGPEPAAFRDGQQNRSLVTYALDAGGHDNVTALLVPVAASVPPAT
ncbi:hypothetical protein [Streptomyces sp. NPDC002889]